ncbi:Neuroglobin [Channa argus]|uniref:Neuroglobin n=1 Tax=Channa argus TaxID=215402 RepID=A0A6G1QGW7_CHAAH|nr:Neuroglobin [Channa argus]KAK2891660.1 hypothetical protein Q8A73_017325 [Channa argus]
MGCRVSGLAGNLEFEGKHMGGVCPCPLSQGQVQMIKDSWNIIHKDISNIGVIVFTRLFEIHPECKDVFVLFREVKDLKILKTSRELREHGLRVMSFIEKVVARLDNLERLEALAVELGRHHYNYNAPAEYYDYMVEDFISAVQPAIKDRWTTELEEAWRALFRYVTKQMKKGYEEAKAPLAP